jgi:heptosyltransferase-3
MDTELRAPAGRVNGGVNRIAIALVEHFGDIVACEPIVGHLRLEFPDAHITWIVRAAYRELIDTHPEIDETLTVGCLTEWILLRQSGLFDRVFDLHFQQRICADCGVPLVKPEDQSGVTLQNYYTFGPLLHAFCRAGGVPVLDDTPRLYIPPSAVSRVDSLNLPESFVVAHCRSNEAARDWTAEGWNDLAHHLAARGHTIVEIGAGTGVLQPQPGRRLISLLGRTSLVETAEVIRRARLFIGIDSGPAHFANAVGTPGVIILGKYLAFDRYLPYSGAYGSGGAAEIVYAENGPAAAVTVDAVCAAVDRQLTKRANVALPAESRPVDDRAIAPIDSPSARRPAALDQQLARAHERRRVRSVVAHLHVPGYAASKAARASAVAADSDLLKSLDREDLGAEQRESLIAATVERHLIGLYNIASWLAKHERTAEAHQLFSSVASTARHGHPALAGRAHFKLAELAPDGDERIAHLTQCVALYPEHREAARQLADVVPTA